MRGYLQRLVEDRAPTPQAGMRVARPAAPSESPIVESDQLLQFEGFDGFADATPADATADTPPAQQARAGPPEPRGRTPAPIAVAPAAKTAAPMTLTRFARPAPALAPARTTPGPAPALAVTPVAAPSPHLAPPSSAPSRALETRTRESEDRADAAPQAPLRAVPLPAAIVVPEPRARAPERDAVSPVPAGDRGPASRPATVPHPALVAEARPAPTAVETEQPAMPAEAPLPPPLAPGEIPLRGTEPARTPQAVSNNVFMRETIRTVVEAPAPKAPAPSPRTPRTAEEASVIGPLPRPERTRALLEVWLR